MLADVESDVTFESLGVCSELCTACEQLKWKKPTFIQREALPIALKGSCSFLKEEKNNL